MADKKPDMNEFLARRIPLATALAARANWGTLTDEEKHDLGFGSSARSSMKLPGEFFPGSIH